MKQLKLLQVMVRIMPTKAQLQKKLALLLPVRIKKLIILLAVQTIVQAFRMKRQQAPKVRVAKPPLLALSLIQLVTLTAVTRLPIYLSKRATPYCL